MKNFSMFVEHYPQLLDKQKLSLYKKSSQSDIPISILEEVYRRGLIMWDETSNKTQEQYAFDRVNSFISGGFAAELDEDLKQACWKGYQAIGMKKKNGKTVPNCIPVKESENIRTLSLDDIAKKHGVSKEYLNTQFSKGVKVEQEHTKNKSKAGEIARDHLRERPDYYTKLSKVEKQPVKESEIDKNAFKAGREAINKELDKYPFKSRYIIPPVDVPKKQPIKTANEQTEVCSKDKNKPSSRFVGSDELVAVYKKDTPGQGVNEATYKGKTVPLNKPMKGDVKKSKVFVDPDGDGKAQKVNFGDKNLSIKKDQPARKRSYCARSGGIKGKRDVTSANYWSRRAWNCNEADSEGVPEALPLQDIAKRRELGSSTKTKDVFTKMRNRIPRGAISLDRNISELSSDTDTFLKRKSGVELAKSKMGE